MLLSVIITTRNRYDDLLECIKSIHNSQGIDFEYEIVVIDDCSGDKTKSLDENILGTPNLKIIHNQNHMMMVKARNVGIQNSIGKYLLFIDDDNVIESNMIRILIDFITQQKEFTIIGPSIAFHDCQEKYFFGQKIGFFSGKTYNVPDKSPKAIPTDGIPNVFLIPREIFEKIGNFDEDMVQTFTEPDFYFHAKKKLGCKAYIIQDALTYHKVTKKDKFRPRSLGGQYKQKAYFLMRNRTVLIFRYGKNYHKIIYLLFFSRLRPLIYSFIILFNQRFDLIQLYWLGFADGIKYVFDPKSLKLNRDILKGK